MKNYTYLVKVYLILVYVHNEKYMNLPIYKRNQNVKLRSNLSVEDSGIRDKWYEIYTFKI